MTKGVMWNLWHGCRKKSEGCKNCYVYRGDSKYDRDSSKVFKTQKFYEPIQKNKKGEYKHKSGTLFWTCFSSDFLLEDADEWRSEALDIMRERSDCNFFFITKRIERFLSVMPADFSENFQHIGIGVTCENQKRVDERLPIFVALPISHKVFIHEPLLGDIDISKYLSSDISQVVAGGESGTYARDCHFEWIESICKQCKTANVSFHFKQTGTYFVKDNKRYIIDRKLQHSQARKADINFIGKNRGYI